MQTGTERTNEGSGSTPVDQARTAESAGAAPTDDSPKPHGDKLGSGAAATVTASEVGQPGDSAKRQGDKLEHAVDEAAGR